MQTIEEEEKANKRVRILYIIIILICVISLIAAIILQIKKDNTYIGESNNGLNNINDEQKVEYKENFDNIFDNKVKYLQNNSYKIEKLENDKEIIYTGYQIEESKVNDYELKVNIPYINIKSDYIYKINEQIKEIFEKKAKSTLNTQNGNVIYNVNYSAYVTNNILSLVIRSTLKQGNTAQRDIVQTYNYDLINQKEIKLEDLLEMKNITKQQANTKIRDEIKNIQKRVEELEKLGYSVYPRDYTSDIYSVNNVKEFFIGENDALYIIFAYGNENLTSEMDIVIL